MFNAHISSAPLASPVNSDRKSFQRLFRFSLLLFAVIALIGRLLPKSWRPMAAQHAGDETVMEEARRIANTILPYLYVR